MVVVLEDLSPLQQAQQEQDSLSHFWRVGGVRGTTEKKTRTGVLERRRVGPWYSRRRTSRP